MKKCILLLLGIALYCISAELGDLTRSSDVVTGGELVAFAVDPNTLQLQITANTEVLDGGITTNLNGFVISDGIIVGTL